MPRLRLTFLPRQADLPIDRALADLLTVALQRPVGRGLARRLLTERRVCRRGLPLTLRERAEAGSSVDVEIADDEMRISHSAAAPLFDPGRHVIYRDRHWLALAKPAGLLVHPGADKNQPDLVTLVANWLGEVPFTLHHRLDRETSGLVLFSLSDEGRRSVAAQFEAREADKGYLCQLSPGRPLPPRWTCNQSLNERRGRVFVDSASPSSKSACTEFRQLGGLVEACPRTGRKHQIRVHLAWHGRPITGDPLYGGAPGPRLMLHAHWLRLTHPDGQAVRLEAPLPADFRP